MHFIELDARNLARWFRAVSDRAAVQRGMRVFT